MGTNETKTKFNRRKRKMTIIPRIDKLAGDKDIRFRDGMKCKSTNFWPEVVEVPGWIEKGLVPYCIKTGKLCVAYDASLFHTLYDPQRAELCPSYKKK